MSGRGGLVFAGIVVALGLCVLLVVGAGAGWIMLGGSSMGPASLIETEPEAPLPTAPDRGEAAESGEPAPLPRADGGVEDGAAGAATAGTASNSTLAPLEAGVVQAIAVSKRTEQPLAGAVLTLTPRDPESSAEGFTSEPSGADGRITLTNVAAGDYTLRVTRPGCEPAERAAFAMSAAGGRDAGPIALVPTPALTGTVQRSDGTAAAGARVELVNEVALQFGPEMSIMDVIADLKSEEEHYGTVNADAQGRYTVWWDQALPGAYALRVSVKGSATAHAGVTLAAGAVAERDFSLGAPVVFAGTVKDHEGNPCAGCRLIAVPEPNEQMLMRERKMMIFRNIGTVNATGAFRFDQLAAGRYMLFAGGGGYTQKMINNVAVPNEAYAIQLERGTTLRGRVRDARTGGPIAGAKVAIGGDGGFDVGRTDEDGRYEFTGIANRGLEMFVEAAGYPTAQRRVPRDAEQQVLQFDVELEPGLVLRGRVVSAADGRGVAGARVLVLPEGAGFAPGGIPRTTTGADGRFEVRGVSTDPRGMGRVEVRVDGEDASSRKPAAVTMPVLVSAPGYAQGEPHRVTITAGEQPAPFDVPMLVAARVRGRVVDADGTPVAGAVINWRQLQPADLEPGSQLRPNSTSMMAGMLLPAGEVRTGADGTFVLGDVRPGAATVITATHPKMAAVSSSPVRTEGGKEALCPDLALTGGARLVVVARGPDGAAAPGQQVQIERKIDPEDVASGKVDPMELAMQQHAQPKATGADGRVEFTGLAAGSYRVRSRGPLVSAKTVTVEVGEGGEVTAELVLVASRSVSGVVRDHLGGVPTDGWIWIEPVDGADVTGRNSQQLSGDGTFRFDGLAPGLYRISAWGAGGTSAAPIEVQAGQTGVTLQFQAPPGEGK
ncbi:MAG: carboxypeptidase regulatory-like domain-containing protein [Planctomycetota bacterium]|jgi:protocatechuate 3,4-dioxygenase beta subunit